MDVDDGPQQQQQPKASPALLLSTCAPAVPALCAPADRELLQSLRAQVLDLLAALAATLEGLCWPCWCCCWC